MQKWYEDTNLSIFFSDTPCVAIRVILASDSDFEKKSKNKYPFINKREFQVIVLDHVTGKKYDFSVFRNYCWNGADIPRFLWATLGISRTSNEVLIASLLHDFVLEHKDLIDYDRKLSTNIFKGCIIEAGIPKWKSNIMANAVDIFQKTICAKAWKGIE